MSTSLNSVLHGFDRATQIEPNAPGKSEKPCNLALPKVEKPVDHLAQPEKLEERQET